MVNNAVILQHYFTDDHTPMIDITKMRHQKYADKHGFDLVYVDLRTINSDIGRDTAEAVRVDAVNKFLHKYEYIACFDLDVIIHDMSVDLRNATEQIGAVRFDADKPMPTLKDAYTYKFYSRNNHLNLGVFYVNRTPLTIKIVEEWANLSRDIGGWYSCQRAFNILSMKYELPDIDARWNYSSDRQPLRKNPVVVGYHRHHPVERKIEAMQADMRKYG